MAGPEGQAREVAHREHITQMVLLALLALAAIGLVRLARELLVRATLVVLAVIAKAQTLVVVAAVPAELVAAVLVAQAAMAALVLIFWEPLHIMLAAVVVVDGMALVARVELVGVALVAEQMVKPLLALPTQAAVRVAVQTVATQLIPAKTAALA